MSKCWKFILMAILISACRHPKYVSEVDITNCDLKTAELIAIERYTARKKHDYNFESFSYKEDSSIYLIGIMIVEPIKETIIGTDTLITEIKGGCEYTIDKKTCKIVKVKRYE